MSTRGFMGRRPPPDVGGRIPPGQSQTDDFPVLSAGPTPRVRTEHWNLTLKVGPKPIRTWSWAELNALPQTKLTADIHCVTKWSKLDTAWEGVSIDDLLTAAGIEAPTAYTLAHSADDYTTNVPTADLIGFTGD
jgi:DMSO/TMAO reductase YedYZ molybdopterin-dependent catalytic subunit